MDMTDIFAGRDERALIVPISNAAAVTPSDSADLEVTSRQLHIGTGGNLKVTLVGGDTVTYYNLASGQDFARRVSRVWSTGTTCSNIVAEW
jgi:hypothetical protein